MAQLPTDFSSVFRASGVTEQVREAERQLTEALGDRVEAGEICKAWQDRFLSALHSEIPDWNNFAGFRCITDYCAPSPPSKIFPPQKKIQKKSCPKTIDTLELIWRAYDQYFNEGKEIHSGKLDLAGEAEAWFLKKLGQCSPTLGGQAGNILWLLHTVKAIPYTHVPYFSRGLAEFPGLGDLTLLRRTTGQWRLEPLAGLAGQWGVAGGGAVRHGAPSGGSVVVARGGRRLIYQFPGLRDLDAKSIGEMPWEWVQFRYGDQDVPGGRIKRRATTGATWPALNLFFDCYIEGSSSTLVIRLATAEEMGETLQGTVDFAILGGIDTIFRDKWFRDNPELQARLVDIADRQVEALAKRCRVRVGIELSGVPEPEYARLLQRWCRQGYVIALGVNGVDELPHIVGAKSLSDRLYDFWLDPTSLTEDHLRGAAISSDPKDPHFEYVTYLRAKKLAAATGVRTLYVHTNTLDFILRKDADPGALMRTQTAVMMGKGLVIVALLKRAYGQAWAGQLQGIPPAVKPGAMTRLCQFANDFQGFERAPGARDRLLKSGYWLASSPSHYSLSVVPVMWPPVGEIGSALKLKLPRKLNTTGAGDMTFGAFFFLGGV